MSGKIITRAVIVLSLVSLFTDIASEMLYPVMPVYLESIGFSVILIGILEGIAEAVAGLSKGYFGKMSDVTGKRVPFVRLGYALSAVSKPMLAAFAYPLWVFFARTLDRLGKGIRTGARDALLADESTPETKGRIFGFHRSLDTFGAAIGPVLALVYLYFFPGQYIYLFLIAFIPGIISVVLTYLINEKKKMELAPGSKKSVSFLYAVKYLKESPSGYNRLIFGLILFALFNSSDVFLLLMVKHQGYSDIDVLTLYIFYNLVYSLLAYPFGKIADRIGMKNMFLAGLLFFGVTYTGMAMNTELEIYYVLFFVYGMFAAATDGISKAWISDTCEKNDAGVAIGTYAGFQSIAALIASSVAGLLWYGFYPGMTFIIPAIIAGIVFVYFLFTRIQKV
jgi:MFS family permease